MNWNKRRLHSVGAVAAATSAVAEFVVIAAVVVVVVVAAAFLVHYPRQDPQNSTATLPPEKELPVV